MKELDEKANFPKRLYLLQKFYKGKIETLPKCAIRSLDDFSI